MGSLLIAMSVTFIASALQGVTGFGAGLISMGILSSVWSVPEATAVMLPLGVLLNLSLIVQRWEKANILSLKWVFAGLPFGVTIGVHLLEVVPETLLKFLLGLALCASVVNAMIPDQEQRESSFLSALIAGTCAGICGAAFSSSGPPLLIYANLQGWDRDLFRAQLSVLFLTCSFLAFMGLSLRGQISADTLSMSICLTPGVMIGSLIGGKVGTFLPQKIFKSLVLALLVTLSAHFLIYAL